MVLEDDVLKSAPKKGIVGIDLRAVGRRADRKGAGGALKNVALNA